jgi:hypothetical protein
MTPDYGGQKIRNLLPDSNEGGYVERLLQMDPKEFWLRQGWSQGPDGSWSKDTAMRDHIGMVEAQEQLAARNPPRQPFFPQPKW